ncbi:MAG: hypothetical protein U1E36_09920 [Rickettsiales bacterium]
MDKQNPNKESPETQIIAVDLAKIKPNPDDIKKQRRNMTLFDTAVGVTLGGIIGYLIGDYSSLDNPAQGNHESYVAIGAGIGGALGAVLGFEKQTQDERVYKLFVDASKSDDPSKTLQSNISNLYTELRKAKIQAAISSAGG